MDQKRSSEKKKGAKVRKLYHLDPEDTLFVREYAQKKGLSESEVIRQAVRSLQGKTEEDPFIKIIGSVETGSEEAENHDEVIYE